MGAAFEVTSAELRAAQSFVTERAADLQEAFAPVTAEVEDLLGSGWQGTAATAFGTAWSQWHEGSGKILDALGRMAGLLATTAAGYDRADTVVRTDFSRLDGAL